MTVTLRPRMETPSPRRVSRRDRRPLRTAPVVAWPPSKPLVATVLLALSLFTFWYLVAVHSEEYWFSAALTYVPRLPWLLAAGGLALGLAVIGRWKLALVNTALALVAAGPVMGFQFGAFTAPSVPAEGTLTLLSCNAQRFQNSFPETLAEILAAKPDVIAFQEAPVVPLEVERAFRDWHTLHHGEFWIVSRYPLEFLGECESSAFDRGTALKAKVDMPGQPFCLVNVHQMTARRGLLELTPSQVASGEGPALFEAHQVRRRDEAAATRMFATGDTDLPLVVAGDFNTPSTSSLHRQTWSGLANAFDTCGWGWGYTAPNLGPGFWPNDLPWLRIDHILCSREWTIHACEIGTATGSDHRTILAVLSLGD